MKFTIGADPECFLGDSIGVISGIGKIGGSKQFPLPLPLGEGFAVQEDNVALEFNIPPSSTKYSFVNNITTALSFLEQAMQDRHGLHFVKESAVSFPDSELAHPQAREFGCDSDFNAWTNKRNPIPKASDKNLRSCGGHIHVGIGMVDHEKLTLMRAMDLYLGVPSVLMDKGEKRKQLYGKAGATRIKSYGAEYRVLSNFWIFDTQLIEWVYDGTEAALESVYNATPFEIDGELIQYAINANSKETAALLVDKYELNVVYA